MLDDGWFRFGDLATISSDGFVSIVGRKKDVILRGGYTIAAGEIEAVLAAHPDIIEAAVIGVPDRELGEEMAAFVTLRSAADRPTVSSGDIVDFCRNQLASFTLDVRSQPWIAAQQTPRASSDERPFPSLGYTTKPAIVYPDADAGRSAHGSAFATDK